jgi:hypothetical protein
MRSQNTAIEWQATKVNATVLNEQRPTQESKNLPWWESQRGFIRSSKSLTEYSILFVSKKNDTKQLCVNYRQLNKITRQDSYPLPLIEELQDRLGRVKWFTSLTWKKPIMSTNEGRQRMKKRSEQDTDTTNTLLCCLSSRTPPPPFKG